MSLTEYEKDPRLFLFTSLTAGSSHIISATSRMETILKANRIPFQAIDLATDEKARKLWQRRGQKKKLPGLVKDGFVLGDLEEIEDWNEFGELRENIGPVPESNAAPAGSGIVGVSTAPPIDHNVPGFQSVTNSAQPAASRQPPKKPGEEPTARIALPGAAEIAAMNKAKKEKQAASRDVVTPATQDKMESAPSEKEKSVESSKEAAGEDLAPADIVKSETATIATEATGAGEAAATSASSEPATKSDEATPSTKAAAELDPSESTSTETRPKSPTVDVSDIKTPAVEPIGSEAQPVLADDTNQKNKESEAKEASPKDSEKLPQDSALKEEVGEDADADTAAKGVEDLKVSTDEKTQAQEAKAATEASKSVDD